MWCMCICPSITLVDSVETNEHIYTFVYHQVANPFHTKCHGNIPVGTPNRASNAGEVCGNFDFEPFEPMSNLQKSKTLNFYGSFFTLITWQNTIRVHPFNVS